MKSYVQKQFTSSHEVKTSSLQNEFYVPDMLSLGGGWEDITTERLEQDDGLETRASLIAESRDVNFCFKPCFDLANCERAFPAGYTLTLEFERADPKFSLLAADNSINYKIRIYDIALEVRRFTPSGSALRALPNPRTGTYYLPFARSVSQHFFQTSTSCIDVTIRSSFYLSLSRPSDTEQFHWACHNTWFQE